MGEQTILCGMLQTGAILGFEKMVEDGIDEGYAAKLIQYGWETVTEALKYGGITNMMDRLSNPAKVVAFDMAEDLKELMRPLFRKHQADIIEGEFSATMMADWANDDKNLLTWREETLETGFEKAPASDVEIDEQEYFDHGIMLVAMIKAGVELAFESMVESGIVEESAYYESLHETPLIANTIARRKLYEMNVVISDTAEYGNYLFSHAAVPLLREKFMPHINTDVIGKGLKVKSNSVDNKRLIEINELIRNHPVEWVGQELRGYMTDMQRIIETSN
jgi:ketol-acid reductoisomerase